MKPAQANRYVLLPIQRRARGELEEQLACIAPDKPLAADRMAGIVRKTTLRIRWSIAKPGDTSRAYG